MKSPDSRQELPPGDERLQDDVAQVGVVVQELPQGVGRDLVDLAIAPGDGADDRRAAGQLRDVAGELPGAVDRDGLRRLAGLVHDLDLAGLDDEEVEVAVAGLEELFPVLEAPELRQRTAPQRGHLGLVELGKGDGVQIVLGHVSISSGRSAVLCVNREGTAWLRSGTVQLRPDRRSTRPSARRARRTRPPGGPCWWKCFVAWRPGELSQQPTWPQLRQRRR